MTAHQNGTISTGASEFLLNCFVRSPTWQLWLSLPLGLLFLVAMGANGVLLITIWLEASLHQPLYYLLSLLSLLDIVLCLTVIPKVLAIFWFDLKSISFDACFLQMFIMNFFYAMESCTFMVMAYDRYVAICHPLRYPSIITEQFVAKAAIFILARNAISTLPIPILSSRLHYCGRNVIENCICANMSVSKLSCDDVTINRLYQFAGGWTLLGSDLVLIFISYSLILQTVMGLKAEGAMAKALSTCGSHFILILFFSTVLLVFVLTHMVTKNVSPDVPVLLNVLHHVIPAALNPIVYGVRTQEIKQGIQRLLKKGW
ncbi:olfactory receptor 56A3-like [Canis lupus baileyi]|uniref:Olfactory receptor family 56 subfamily A member 3C n=2 Tax=Canis lupus TaxID=9612 RepID=A0A8I3N548_CANLF|nr:olfactory receptor family 56 subfamily A member 3C [Canis lupus familiaris]XP_048955059.1 olfactory receptor 56A3-like [Canis lupus dingo]|eukprot:NP_001243429.1 olfactory receptor family 56 subfamily A, member 6 [Canis lupus familiaris]